MSRLLCGVAVTLGLLGAIPARASLLIDNYTTSQNAVAISGVSNPVFSSASGAGVIGGVRDVLSQAPAAAGANTVVTIAGGNFNFSTSGSTGFAMVTYDGSSSQTLVPAGLGGIDATQGGSNKGISLTGADSSTTGLSVVITLYTDATHYSTATLIIPGGSSTTTFFTPFSIFTEGVGAAGAFNPTSLGAITEQLSFPGGVSGGSGSASLQAFTPVAPEPSTMALSVSAFLCFAGYGYRRFRMRQSV